MADEQNQRPYRGNEASQRPASAGSAPASSDPLAELARLIGQNDPFSEFGRDGSKRVTAATQRQPEPTASWQAEPARIAPATPQSPTYGSSPDFSRQSFGSAPLAGGSDNYYTDGQAQPAMHGVPDHDVPGYGAPGYEATGFPAAPGAQGYEDAYQQNAAQNGDYYDDDVRPSRRRMGVLAIAGLFALAVIGTAGAFGYRAVFGTSSTSGPPPVIKAEQAPSKIVPAAVANKDAPKIAERINDRAGEKLVSREEQPVVVTTTVAAQPQGSGVVGSEPKRIRTIAIKPDQPGDANMPPPVDSIPAPTAQPRVITTTPQRPPAQQAQQPQAQPPAAPARAAAPTPSPVEAAPSARAEAPANAPLSLNPGAQAPARAAAPQRAAAISPPPPTSTGSTGVYGVQVTAQRSEEEAQTAFRQLQGKFPGQLGNRQAMIKRVDAGEKGIFYGAQVGPFTDSSQAKQMCESYKAAGGSCLVKKN